ncbi:MAG: hypothetical protein ABFS45_06050 [Pseudomonadota bacterium]
MSDKPRWKRLTDQIEDWSAWLAQGDTPEEMAIIRRNLEEGLACGSDRFIKKLEKMVGGSLTFRPQGRPKQEEKKG